MILKNQDVEWLQRCGRDTQNFLEQMLFNSFVGLKASDIVPFAGVIKPVALDKRTEVDVPVLSTEYLRIYFYDTDETIIEIDDGSAPLVAGFFDVLKDNIELPEGITLIQNSATHNPIFVNTAGDEIYLGITTGNEPNRHDFHFVIEAFNAQRVSNDVLYYGKIVLTRNVGNIEALLLGKIWDLYEYDYLVFNGLSFEGDDAEAYFVGYKVSIDNVPLPVQVDAPVIVIPPAGDLGDVILFYSAGPNNSEGQAVLAYKTTFSGDIVKINFSDSAIDLDYDDTDASAMLLLTDGLQGQLKVSGKSSDGALIGTKLYEVSGDILPFNASYFRPDGFRLDLVSPCDCVVKWYDVDEELISQGGDGGLHYNSDLGTVFYPSKPDGSTPAKVGITPTVNGYECPFEVYFILPDL